MEDKDTTEIKKKRDKDISEQFEFVHESDAKSRGFYLIQATLMENLIDEILGYHFCPENKINREMLVATIVNDLGFATKINNLLKILKTSYPKLHKNSPKLKKQLEHVRELRNKFAHSTPDFSTKFLETKADFIRLTFYKNGKKETQDLSYNFMMRRLKESGDIILQLIKILEVISKRKAQLTRLK